MAISQEERAQYETNRNRKTEADRIMQIYFRGSLILAAFMFVMTFLAGVMSASSDITHGPEKFYSAMNSGLSQILMCFTNLILAFVAKMGKRLPSLMQLGFNAAVAIYYVTQDKFGMKGINLALCTVGVALCVLVQFAFNAYADLKTQPGWPHFSPEAAVPAQYEAPAYVIRAQQAHSNGEMLTVGTAGAQQMPGTSAHPSALPAVSADALGISDMTAGNGSRPQPVVLEKTASLPEKLPELTGFEAASGGSAQSGAQNGTAVPEQPVSAEAAEAALGISAMDDGGHSRLYAPNPAAIPSAEEVMKKLAQMKQQSQT